MTMDILKAEHIGFCFGVQRAINMVYKELTRGTKRIYTIGPIIHNPQMVKILKEKGVIPVEDVSEIEEGTVIFRTHGIKKEEEAYIKQRGLRIIDTTCPFVKRVRKYAMYLKKNTYTVVIVGDSNHPEVKSVLSYLGNDGIVLQKPAPVNAKKIGIVSQTTQDKDTFVRIIEGLLVGAEEMRIYNTICENTEIRQREAKSLARQVDIMLIIGGTNSANTKKLYNIVKHVQPLAYHIETEDEIKPQWFSDVHKVGITGGASTPDFIIDVIEKRIKNF
ncbi:MAG TPA: 4-hydroxy-3-methylbut-2-enyl diphosphate reductase [Deltaproteobacteria bacterium]|nr:4-hydroxy-3-methylbut-2-enyl diphosphate reductase [Deltaproteobacteria bacterium]